MTVQTRALPDAVVNTHDPHSLHRWDGLLAQYRPFGDSDYLHQQIQLRYKRRLETIAAVMPVAGKLSRALEQASSQGRYRTVGDPAVRHAVQQALRQIVNGTQDGLPLGDCEEVFRQSLLHLEQGKSGGPTASGVVDLRRLGKDPCHGWIWTEEHRDDVFGRSFRTLVQENFQSENVRSPRAADLARLAHGAALLSVLLPSCSRGALSHAHVVVLFDGAKASCSDFRVGGTILLNREMLDNPWWVAEHLLHESLHQKLYDFRHTHSLLTRDLSREPRASAKSAATIASIWNVATADRSNEWDTFRAVAAFHVYVHVALLWLQAERRTEDRSFPAAANRRRAFGRAQYLGKQLQEASSWQELGVAGQLLVDGLMSIVNEIDPSPPPAESLHLHLLLDRYVSEAALVAGKSPSPELSSEVQKLIDEEAGVVRHVLAATTNEGDADLDRLKDAVLRRPEEGAGAAFLRFRSVVAGIVHALSPDGDELELSRVQARIDTSSRRVADLLNGRLLTPSCGELP